MSTNLNNPDVNNSLKQEDIDDSNTPLHFLKPDYVYGYGISTLDAIEDKLQTVLHFIDQNTSIEVEDRNTHKTISDISEIDANSQIRRGKFRLTSYEWGVTYIALLKAFQATRDSAYSDYVKSRVRFLANVAPCFKPFADSGELQDEQMLQVLKPEALDDCGAICASMVNTLLVAKEMWFMDETGEPFDHDGKVRALIDNYLKFALKGENHLSDGIYARNRPFKDTVWLDDMFMAIPLLCRLSKFFPEKSEEYLSEAVKQCKLFIKHMFVPETSLFRHGMVEPMAEHPAYYWGRANGWAFLTLCELLDYLPSDHADRPFVVEHFKAQAKALRKLQNIDGMWTQLLDRNNTYSETSCTAIFIYGMAHGINMNILDAKVYGPVVQLALHALMSKIGPKGEVREVCVGTGMGFDPAFYAMRPVHSYAAHGYGTAILALAESIKLLKQEHPCLNDSAVHFYNSDQNGRGAIFNEE